MDKSQQINKQKMNNIHERALRLIYCDHLSNFQELFERDNTAKMHQKISRHWLSWCIIGCK